MSGLYNFDGADTSPLPSPWSLPTGWHNLRRVSNQCANAAGSNDDAAMRRTDSTAQRSIFEYRSGTFDGGPALLDANGNGYICTFYTGTTVELYTVTGGPSYGRIGPDGAVTAAAGDIFELMIDGNDVVVLKNSVEVLRVTDTTYRTGLTPAAFVYEGSLRIDNHTDGATGQNITVGLTSETDSTLAISRLKSKAVGLATETDSVLAASRKKSKTVGLASETDSAFSVSVQRSGGTGIVVETDTAQSAASLKSKTVGLTTETDSTFSTTHVRSRVVGLTTETDSAFSVGKAKTRSVGLASESDSSTGVDVGGGLPTSYFTDFPLTENPINQGGMFKVGSVTGFYQDPRSTPGRCFASATSAGYDDCLAQLQNHAVPDNHRVTVTIYRDPLYTAGDSHEVGIYIRMTIGVGPGGIYVTAYEFLMSIDGSFQIIRWEGTSHDIDNFNFSIVVTGSGPGALVTGDVVAVQVIGEAFEVYKNGVLVATASDDVHATGNPGMGFFVRPTGNDPTKYNISTWMAEAASTMVPVGQAVETDSAFSVSRRKMRTAGLNSETDTAFSVSRFKNKAVGLTSESDSVLAATRVKARAVGLTSETDTVFSVSKRKAKLVGLVFEADGSFSVEGGQQSGGGGAGRRLGFGLGLR